VDTDVKEPLFMSNYTFQEDCGNWQAVQTDTIIPACFDEGFRGSGLGLCVKNFTPLLPAAIFKGTFLTVKLRLQKSLNWISRRRVRAVEKLAMW
jgi:hypothetical protein